MWTVNEISGTLSVDGGRDQGTLDVDGGRDQGDTECGKFFQAGGEGSVKMTD